jgi:hypothetical protein
MGSIKLGQAISMAANFLGAKSSSAASPKQSAVDLLRESPLEMNSSRKSSTAHLVKNPLAFTSLQYPRDLGIDGGHFIIFYSISNNKSIDIDQKFAKSIGMKMDQEDIMEDYEVAVGPGGRYGTETRQRKVGNKYGVKKLKKSKNGGEITLGRPAPNSVLTGGLSTHTMVTGGVSLYMPPGIKATYSASTGHSELGKAGMLAGSVSRMMAAKSTSAAIEEALKGLGGFALTAARDLAVGVGETMGLGDIDGAISKVTATAQNNFSEAIFEKINARSFSYTFKLIARNKEEAQDINKIVKFFKFHMHPELDMANGGRYFRTPSEFEIHYAYNDQKNNYLHELSRCVCSDVEVSYGDGDFQSFRQFDGEGAAPVEVSLALTFTETTVLTKKEIADNY